MLVLAAGIGLAVGSLWFIRQAGWNRQAAIAFWVLFVLGLGLTFAGIGLKTVRVLYAGQTVFWLNLMALGPANFSAR